MIHKHLKVDLSEVHHRYIRVIDSQVAILLVLGIDLLVVEVQVVDMALELQLVHTRYHVARQ